MNRIDLKFKELKAANKKAFIAFITAGYPDLSSTERLVLEFDKIGVDIVELGVPFSDPIADGPIIQNASHLALKKGVNLFRILSLVKKLRRKTQIPICLMSYYNPIFCFPANKFIESASRSGVDGIIVPDLPMDEAGDLISISRKFGIKNILFISPTSPKKRVKEVAKKASGFIYYVSLTGVTGSRSVLPSDLKSKILSIKSVTKKPVCVGFGVSSKKQVKEIYSFADGVIVGSAIIKKVSEYIRDKNLIKKVSNFVRELMNV